MILGIDVSHWNTVTDWHQLKAAGIEFAFIKATQGDYYKDPMFTTNAQGARDAGILVAPYHYFDPGITPQRQVNHFLDTIGTTPHSMLAIDVETNITHDELTIPAKQLSDCANDTAALCAAELKRFFRQTPLLIYTRNSFVTDYAPLMTTWLRSYPLWLATWPYKKGVVSCTWDEFKSFWLPKTTAPTIPKNCNFWDYWQFSGDKFILPGVDGPLDLNYFNGNLFDLYKFLGINPPAMPPATPLSIDQRLANLEAAARLAGWTI